MEQINPTIQPKHYVITDHRRIKVNKGGRDAVTAHVNKSPLTKKKEKEQNKRACLKSETREWLVQRCSVADACCCPAPEERKEEENAEDRWQ